MKKILLTIITALSICLAHAQIYTTGQKDIFGNTTTTVKDPYGRTIGTATTGQKDIFGNTTTTVKDQYAWPIE